MESCGFYDAEELVGGGYDREYDSDQFAEYFSLFISNGVFASPTNQLKVLAGTGMSIIVKEGWAFIKGRWYHNDADKVIPVPANTTAQMVSLGVFVQASSMERDITAKVISNRTEVDRESPIYELKLAELNIPTGTTSITDAMIIDTRANEEVCGFVKGLLGGVIPTADLFAQYDSMFQSWFERMRDQLSEDAAGNLQNEIDDINENLIASNPNAGISEVPFRFGVNNSGEFGYIISEGGADTVVPFKTKHTQVYNITTNGRKDLGENHQYRYVNTNVRSIKRIGIYSSNTSIDVSAYSPTSENQFLAECPFSTSWGTNGGYEWGNGSSGSYGMGWLNCSVMFVPPSVTLRGNTLTVTTGKIIVEASAPSGGGTHTINLMTRVSFVGTID